MAYWLMKSEPAKYGYEDLVRDGVTAWDGVRNNQAALYLKAMKIGDRAFFYHSVTGLCVAGVAQISREAFLDPTDPAGRFVAVEITPVQALPNPVPLAALRAEPALAGMTLFRQFRLSVTPVTPEEWAIISRMGGL
ncbi:MAG: EVE domain-containing protein [Alphaproteobacteria bacterium]|jgi:predicted RNA-binding protein with PUA-like domain|nr:EVE domain-containing protein [Alphaproteobacteria bacterium]